MAIIQLSFFDGKVCRRCLKWKPISEFSTNPVSLDGYFNRCKLCVRYRCVPDDEYFANIGTGLRRCSKCKAWKLIEQFVVCKQRMDGIAPHCIECHRVASNDYARRNRQEANRKNNIWRRDNPKYRATRKANRASNPEPHRARSRDWQKLNSDKTTANYHRRRARIKGNGGSYTVKEWHGLCEKYDNRCLCCGQGGKLTVDHVIPVALGGLNEIGNLQPLCRHCNNVKYMKIIDYRPPEV